MINSKTVILVSLDTTRPDVLFSGKYPFIEKMVKESFLFRNAFVAAPLTPVSHASAFTGLLPKNNGVHHLFKEKIPDNCNTIADLFHENGFKTGGFVSCPGMKSWYNLNKGFEIYDDDIPLLADGTDPLLTVDVEKRGTAKRRAELVTEKGISFLKKFYGEKCFLFLHYFDAHWPYNAPKKYIEGNNYENEIAYSLHYLELLLETLSKDSFYDDLTLIVFNDHGEDLNGLYENDKGGIENGHPEEKGHGVLLYNQTITSFILLYNKKSIPGNIKYYDYVHLVDLFPTISELFNFPSNQYCDGISLVPYIENSTINQNRILEIETFFPEEMLDSNSLPIDSKRAWVFGNRYKIIHNLNSNKLELYDLLADKNEKTNLIG